MFWFISLFSRSPASTTSLLRCFSLLLPLLLISFGLFSITMSFYGSVIECYPNKDRHFINNVCLFDQYTAKVTSFLYYRLSSVIYLIYGIIMLILFKYFPNSYFSSEYSSLVRNSLSSDEHTICLRLLEMIRRRHAVNHYTGYLFRKFMIYFSAVTLMSCRLYVVSNMLGFDLKLYLTIPLPADYFPNFSSCIVKTVGASGTLQRHDYICVLSMNEWYYYLFSFEILYYYFYTVLFCIKIIIGILSSIPILRVIVFYLTIRGHPFISLLKYSSLVGVYDWHIITSLLSKLPPSLSVKLLEELIIDSNQNPLTTHIL